MRNVYLVCYDVADPRRLRMVFKILKGAGDAVQYSVFRCELTREERQQLLGKLYEVLHLSQDRLLFANLGKSDGRGRDCLEYIGDPRECADWTRPMVV